MGRAARAAMCKSKGRGNDFRPRRHGGRQLLVSRVFAGNMSAYVQYAVAFAIILVLLLLLAYILRLITRRSLRPAGGGRGRQPRLGVVEVFDVDRQRQLLLLRRDNVEHLVMIGGPNDVVV